MPRDDAERWRLDHKIPITLILTLLLQAAAIVWWGAKVDARVGDIEREHGRATARLDKLEDARGAGEARIVRLEEQSRQTYEAVRRLEDKIDRVIKER